MNKNDIVSTVGVGRNLDRHRDRIRRGLRRRPAVAEVLHPQVWVYSARSRRVTFYR